MSDFFDWQALEDQLFEQTKETIQRFVVQYPQITCSFFAYAVDPDAGHFLLCFDTWQNGIKMGQQLEQFALKRREKLLPLENYWPYASNTLKSPPITDYSSEVGDFAYQFAELRYPELCDLRERPDYPQKQFDLQDDYLEGNIHIVLWKVIERLITQQSFAPLQLASPFRVGYQFHEEGLLVLRMLNWPKV